jgi:hypothetical protein
MLRGVRQRFDAGRILCKGLSKKDEVLCKEVDSSSLLGACGHDNNECLISTQYSKTANQTDHISNNRIATELHGISSVDKEG